MCEDAKTLFCKGFVNRSAKKYFEYIKNHSPSSKCFLLVSFQDLENESPRVVDCTCIQEADFPKVMPDVLRHHLTAYNPETSFVAYIFLEKNKHSPPVWCDVVTVLVNPTIQRKEFKLDERKEFKPDDRVGNHSSNSSPTAQNSLLSPSYLAKEGYAELLPKFVEEAVDLKFKELHLVMESTITRLVERSFEQYKAQNIHDKENLNQRIDNLERLIAVLRQQNENTINGFTDDFKRSQQYSFDKLQELETGYGECERRLQHLASLDNSSLKMQIEDLRKTTESSEDTTRAMINEMHKNVYGILEDQRSIVNNLEESTENHEIALQQLQNKSDNQLSTLHRITQEHNAMMQGLEQVRERQSHCLEKLSYMKDQNINDIITKISDLNSRMNSISYSTKSEVQMVREEVRTLSSLSNSINELGNVMELQRNRINENRENTAARLELIEQALEILPKYGLLLDEHKEAIHNTSLKIHTLNGNVRDIEEECKISMERGLEKVKDAERTLEVAERRLLNSSQMEKESWRLQLEELKTHVEQLRERQSHFAEQLSYSKDLKEQHITELSGKVADLNSRVTSTHYNTAQDIKQIKDEIQSFASLGETLNELGTVLEEQRRAINENKESLTGRVAIVEDTLQILPKYGALLEEHKEELQLVRGNLHVMTKYGDLIDGSKEELKVVKMQLFQSFEQIRERQNHCVDQLSYLKEQHINELSGKITDLNNRVNNMNYTTTQEIQQIKDEFQSFASLGETLGELGAVLELQRRTISENKDTTASRVDVIEETLQILPKYGAMLEEHQEELQLVNGKLQALQETEKKWQERSTMSSREDLLQRIDTMGELNKKLSEPRSLPSPPALVNQSPLGYQRAPSSANTSATGSLSGSPPPLGPVTPPFASHTQAPLPQHTQPPAPLGFGHSSHVQTSLGQSSLGQSSLGQSSLGQSSLGQLGHGFHSASQGSHGLGQGSLGQGPAQTPLGVAGQGLGSPPPAPAPLQAASPQYTTANNPPLASSGFGRYHQVELTVEKQFSSLHLLQNVKA